MKLGTAAGGEGAKSRFFGFDAVQGGNGTWPIVEMQNLQNSEFFGYGHSDIAGLPTSSTDGCNGLKIGGGSKNINIYGFRGTQGREWDLDIGTEAGKQRTSKVGVWGGLSELGDAVPAARLGDCEDVAFYDWCVNKGTVFHLYRQANESSGAKLRGPERIQHKLRPGKAGKLYTLETGHPLLTPFKNAAGVADPRRLMVGDRDVLLALPGGWLPAA